MNSQRLQKLKEFHQEEPDNPFIIYALAMEYEKSDLDLALKYYRQLLQNHPDYLPTYYPLAHIYWEDDDIEEARQIFKKGIALAKKKNEEKTLKELEAAFYNFQMENDY